MRPETGQETIFLGSGAVRQRFARAYRVLEDAIAAKAFPGCAFGVLAGDEILVQDALGRFTYEGDAPAVTAETVYDLASLTKVVATTAAAMLLFERGRLDVDTPLGALLPAFVARRPADDPARAVTLRHLLAHNSGLPGYVELFRTAATPEALLQACLALKLEAEPGARAEYSDPGFILLGKALEVVMGGDLAMREDLAAWTKREIFAPLRLGATRFSPQQRARAAIPPTEEDAAFRRRRIQGEVQDENAWVLGGVAGHAGLFSNVPDLLRFASAILSVEGAEDGAGNEQIRLVRGETVERFARRQAPEGSSRALGWDTPSGKSSSGKHFSKHSIGHLGYSGCSLWIDLDARIAVVLLTNRTWPDRKSQLIREVRPAFHDAIREALGR
ncbi:MAG TPA: serine hydrolase domain-containing protein [Terracidiphilus sp.]|jgi:CubicO group peptidase (beta-lactamase class C family)